MPREPRLDAPGALHHVIARGIEGRAIFADDADRDGFVRRLSILVEERGIAIYAWSLMPNHLHLLVRTGDQRLDRCMRSLLTAHALAFNRRHGRVGHLFQGRYRSILCEAQSYLLEVTRYIHLNPLRGGIVGSVEALDAYPYAGHAAVLGTMRRSWQSIREVLAWFGDAPDRARAGYRRFIAAGVDVALLPSALRPAAPAPSRVAPGRTRDLDGPDELVLGSGEFVRQALGDLRSDPVPAIDSRVDVRDLARWVSEASGVPETLLVGRSRLREVCRAREGIAYLWVRVLGRSARGLAMQLGLAPVSVLDAAERGERRGAQWRSVLERETSRRGDPEEPMLDREDGN